MQDGQIDVGGAHSGREQSRTLGRYLAQAEDASSNTGRARASLVPPAANEYRAGVPWDAGQLWATINLLAHRDPSLSGGLCFHRGIPAFNEAVIREAVLNAVAHRRDYRKT